MIVYNRGAGPFLYKCVYPPGMEPILLQVVNPNILETTHFILNFDLWIRKQKL
jgi:hypothetical protein